MTETEETEFILSVYAVIWVLSGIAAWAYGGWYKQVIGILLFFDAVVAGPFVWIPTLWH